MSRHGDGVAIGDQSSSVAAENLRKSVATRNFVSLQGLMLGQLSVSRQRTSGTQHRALRVHDSARLHATVHD